jgi:hypothetical protein
MKSAYYIRSIPGGPIIIIRGAFLGASLSLSNKSLAISSTIFFLLLFPSISIIFPLNWLLTPSIFTLYSDIASFVISSYEYSWLYGITLVAPYYIFNFKLSIATLSGYSSIKNLSGIIFIYCRASACNLVLGNPSKIHPEFPFPFSSLSFSYSSIYF